MPLASLVGLIIPSNPIVFNDNSVSFLTLGSVASAQLETASSRCFVTWSLMLWDRSVAAELYWTSADPLKAALEFRIALFWPIGRQSGEEGEGFGTALSLRSMESPPVLLLKVPDVE